MPWLDQDDAPDLVDVVADDDLVTHLDVQLREKFRSHQCAVPGQHRRLERRVPGQLECAVEREPRLHTPQLH